MALSSVSVVSNALLLGTRSGVPTERRRHEHRRRLPAVGRLGQDDPPLRRASACCPRCARTESGYRQYDAATVHTLRFIRRARDLGFGMPEIDDAARPVAQPAAQRASHVKRIALEHAADLQRRIDAMQRDAAHAASTWPTAATATNRPGLPDPATTSAGDDAADRRPISEQPLTRSGPSRGATAGSLSGSATAAPSSARPAARRCSLASAFSSALRERLGHAAP